MTLKATQEQEAIVDLASRGASFKITAFAGAAKTTSLVMVSKAVEHQSLYLAYNKRMADEAKMKFPEWVEVRTVHSLAYGFSGTRIAHKLKRPVGHYVNVAGTPSEIGRYFGIKTIRLADDKKITSVALGQVVRDTVNAFENSSDDFLTEKHIVYGQLTKWIKARKISIQEVGRLTLKHAQDLWKLRSDPNSNVLATHDTYLKMYQLSKPDLSEYRTIYLDEAQDSNNCVLDIVLNQPSQLIIVGDSLQSIYQWRGSIDALEKVNLPEKKLTKSFRFGQIVADIAKTIIAPSKVVEIEGFDQCDTKIIMSQSKMPFPYTKIFRTNTELLIEAIEKLDKGLSVYIEVDTTDLVRSIESCVALKEDRKKDVKHDMFIGCDTWSDAILECKTDLKMKQIVEMVVTNAHIRVLSLLATYRKPDVYDVLFITAHKSKGLEWDNVVIADDYPSVFYDGEYDLEDQERNLQYVANTRARKHLCFGSSVGDIYLHKISKWEIPQSVIDIFEKDEYGNDTTSLGQGL